MIRFVAYVAADLDAGIGAGDLVVADAIKASDLHVFDRFGLHG
jgi:hypothetical protein